MSLSRSSNQVNDVSMSWRKECRVCHGRVCMSFMALSRSDPQRSGYFCSIIARVLETKLSTACGVDNQNAIFPLPLCILSIYNYERVIARQCLVHQTLSIYLPPSFSCLAEQIPRSYPGHAGVPSVELQLPAHTFFPI